MAGVQRRRERNRRSTGAVRRVIEIAVRSVDPNARRYLLLPGVFGGLLCQG